MNGEKSDRTAAREARLAKTLRANLKRRKAQQRGRAEDAPSPAARLEPDTEGDSATNGENEER